MTLTVPALPPNLIRLRTPTISETSNDGSSVVGVSEYPELELTLPENTESGDRNTLPTAMEVATMEKEAQNPRPPVRLTTTSLAKQHEEIGSAVETMPDYTTPNQRLLDLRDSLLSADADSHKPFTELLKDAQELLRELLERRQTFNSRLFNEVQQILDTHSLRPASSPAVEASLPAVATTEPRRIPAPTPSWSEVWDNHERRIREWRQYPDSVDKGPSLRELAKPLYMGEGLPNYPEAARLIQEQIDLEKRESDKELGAPKEIRYVNLTSRATASGLTTQEKALISSKPGKQPRRTRQEPTATPYSPSHSPPPRPSGRMPPGRLPPEMMGSPEDVQESRKRTPPDIGKGHLMPIEMKTFDPNRDVYLSRNSSVSEDDSDGGEEEQLMLGETPFLQAMLSNQIKRDLAAGSVIT